MIQHHQAPSPPSGSESPIRVLLVDDQRFIGLALERLLATETDIQLHCCDQASEAIARANAIAPALILQDMVMPQIDGLTLVGLFRQNPVTARTPIIMLSANDDAASRERSLAAGANDYLLKLPGKSDLIACLRKHATGHPGPDMIASDSAAGRGRCSEDTLDLGVIAVFREPPPDGRLSEFARMLFGQFIREAESRVAVLGNAARDQNAQLLSMTAHSLRGSSLTVGAARLGRLCGQLEAGIGEDCGELVAPGLLAAIDDELVLVRQALGTL